LRDSLEKTGRRLTSDPIRTSLGLLPSGPDPVGEWLVHRQSPGAYLGPKGPESKRGREQFAGLVQKPGKALVAVMPGLVPGIHVFPGKKADVDGRDIGERKRRRPSDGYART
jgi:hypothetical protein